MPVLLVQLLCLTTHAAENLKPVAGWEEVASGVWKAEIGEPDKEMSYTSLAARPPRIEALNALPKVPFPFGKSPIEFQRNPFFPAFGPVTSSFRGLPQKANSLQ